MKKTFRLLLYCAWGIYALIWCVLFQTNIHNKIVTSEMPLTSYPVREKSPEEYYNLSNTVINPVNYSFILNSESTCRDVNPYMIIFIPSRPKQFLLRHAIRQTYSLLSSDRFNMLNRVSVDQVVRSVFIVAKSGNKLIDQQVYDEGKEFDDVVLLDFKDSYYNLTTKVLHALKWVSMYCNNAKYVLKADDDVFINVAMLLKRLESFKPSANGSLFGKVLNNTINFVVERSHLTKWGVTYEEYPLNKYPSYLQGTSYILTSNIVPHIVKTAQFLPYLHIEDVFITGIIAQNILGANLNALDKWSNHADAPPNPCTYVEMERLAQTSVDAIRMFRLWTALKRYTYVCHKTTPGPEFPHS